MAGLGVVLDVQRTKSTTINPNIITKTLMLKHFTPASPPLAMPTTFLDACSLCNKKLSLGMDIYMYRGDEAFCSVECRDKQIFMDEETIWRETHYFPISTTSNATRTSATGGGLFAY